MKISGPRPAGGTVDSRRRRAASSASDDFKKRLEEPLHADAPLPTVDVGGVMSSLLAAQEMPEDETDLAEASKRGLYMLDMLESIRLHMLAGRIPASTLRDIRSALQHLMRNTPDEALNEIIRDVELRAAVELAKIDG